MLKALKPLSVMGIDGVTQVIAREVEFAQVAGVPLEGSLCHGLSGRMLNLANQTGKYDDRLRDSFLDYVKIMRDSDLCLSDSLMLGRSGVLYTAVKLYTGETHGSPLYCELGD